MIPHFLPFAELEVAAEGTKEEVMVAKFCVAPTKAHSEAAEVIRYNIRYGSISSGWITVIPSGAQPTRRGACDAADHAAIGAVHRLWWHQ